MEEAQSVSLHVNSIHFQLFLVGALSSIHIFTQITKNISGMVNSMNQLA